MSFKDIQTTEQLREILEDKPNGWSSCISARAAQRALPFMASDTEEFILAHALTAFHCNIVCWSAYNAPAQSVDAALRLLDILMVPDELGSVVGRPKSHAGAYTIESAVAAVDAQFNDPFTPSTSACHAVEDCARAARSFTYGKHGSAEIADGEHHRSWNAVSIDYDWLVRNSSDSAVRVISRRSLWMAAAPSSWLDTWSLLAGRLLRFDPNYSVWIDWYERRIRGERAAFDIPGDKGRIEDKKILRRLAEATNEDFWGKGHEYVNATLKGWLDEARARVAPSPIIGEASGALEISGSATGEMGPMPPEVPAKLPSQNTNAISFRTDNDGRIAINADALADRVRTDAGARDRHEEAVNEARNALNRCQGNNAAARLTGLLTNYLVAAGENLKTTKPSLLVQRGERLRQELARYEAPDHMLPPVADDLLLDLKGWLTAHNMVVGLDPVLNAMDTAMLGPDRQPTLIPPDEIREKAREAEEADLLQDGVIEVVEEAADLAPAVPDANDRHTIWSTEIVRNLIIETASVALNNPAATGTVVAVGALLSSGLAVGIAGGVSIMGSIKAAEYLVTHKEWVLARLGNTPTWQALITKLSDWLEKMTPFEPK